MKSITHKTCNKCKVDKPISEFGELASSRDGYKYRCDACVREHLDVRVRYSKSYRENNSEKVAESSRVYRERNRKKLNAASIRWNRDNIVRRRETQLEWHTSNPDKYSEYSNRRRARKLENGVYDVRQKFLRRLYTSPCILCGAMDGVTADHIIPIARGGTHSEGNLQPLCKSCNSSKGAKLMVEFRQSRPDLFGCRIEVT